MNMNAEKNLYIQPEIIVIANEHLCDTAIGNWGSEVEDAAGKKYQYDEDDDDFSLFYQEYNKDGGSYFYKGWDV